MRGNIILAPACIFASGTKQTFDSRAGRVLLIRRDTVAFRDTR